MSETIVALNSYKGYADDKNDPGEVARRKRQGRLDAGRKAVLPPPADAGEDAPADDGPPALVTK